jgi:phage-related protein
MTYIRLANFVEVYRIGSAGAENTQYLYHNAEPGAAISYDGKQYSYLSFIYPGAAKNRSGDNLEAGLVLSCNELSQGISRDIVVARDHVRVASVAMSPTGNTVINTLTVESWLAATMTYDASTVEIILSSGIDAVGANAPTRVLTKEMVGHLPSTAQVRSG